MFLTLDSLNLLSDVRECSVKICELSVFNSFIHSSLKINNYIID